MRSRFVVAGFVLATASLLAGQPAQAGLYNTEDPGPPWSSRLTSDEPPVWPTPNLDQFLYVVKQLREVVAPQSSLRKLYDRRIAELERKQQAGSLSIEDRVNLSAYYVRLQQPDKAIAMLEPVRNQPNFMVLSNLATAYEQSGRLDRAVSYAEQALAPSIWPRLWPGLNRLNLNWLYRAEKYHLALLKLRELEQSRQPGKPAEKVDALFPKVRFSRADGTYEINELEPAQLGELPTDNLLVVEQLLLWNPTDYRLYWLFGELLNAQGNMSAACDLFKWLVDSGYSPKELREHRAILNAARETVAKATRESGSLSVLLWALTPRSVTLEGSGGVLANEVGPFGRVEYLKRMSQSGPTVVHGAPPNAPAAPPVQGKGLLHDLRTIAVSFVFGCLATLLIVFQFRETRRRIQSTQTAKTEV